MIAVNRKASEMNLETCVRSCGKWVFSTAQAEVLVGLGFKQTYNRRDSFWKSSTRVRLTATRFIYEAVGQKSRRFTTFQGLTNYLKQL